MPELVLPTPSVRESFLEAMDEFVAEGAENSQTAAWIEHNAPGWRDPVAFDLVDHSVEGRPELAVSDLLHVATQQPRAIR